MMPDIIKRTIVRRTDSFASRRHRGQLQAMEPILIVIVLAVIFGIVLLFYFQLSRVHVGNVHSAARASEDLVMLSKLVRMPELLCSRSLLGDVNCVDEQKAIAFSSLIGANTGAGAVSQPVQNARLFYRPLLGDANITLEWLDTSLPDAQQHQSLPIYTTLSSPNSTTTSITYVTVYDPMKETRYLGWIRVVRRRT